MAATSSRGRAFHGKTSPKNPPPLKVLSQNFLVDQAMARRICAYAKITNNDTVVEIGPGRGALTVNLVDVCKRAVCIEIDRKLAADLKEKFSGTNVEILHSDFMETDVKTLLGENEIPAIAIANLPYHLSTRILFKLIAAKCFKRIVVMVQREVAQRMRAAPGSSNNGPLALCLSAVGKVSVVHSVPPGVFFPRPKVYSSVVVIEPDLDANVDVDGLTAFARCCFAHPRKTIFNNLRSSMSVETANRIIESFGVPPETRPQELGIQQLLGAYEIFKSNAAVPR